MAWQIFAWASGIVAALCGLAVKRPELCIRLALPLTKFWKLAFIFAVGVNVGVAVLENIVLAAAYRDMPIEWVGEATRVISEATRSASTNSLWALGALLLVDLVNRAVCILAAYSREDMENQRIRQLREAQDRQDRKPKEQD